MRILVSCEHATAVVPAGLDLGVPAAVLRSHVSWDPGALPVARAIAWRLGAPLFASAVSRLVADANRREDNPAVVPEVAFGVPVPGNRGLSPEERERRIAAFHRPYREALRAAATAVEPVLHLSVHSFTPDLPTGRRDHDVGLLLDPRHLSEARWADRLLRALVDAGYRVLLDEPYPGTGDSAVSWLRASLGPRGYSGIEIELNQAMPARRRMGVAVVLARAVDATLIRARASA